MGWSQDASQSFITSIHLCRNGKQTLLFSFGTWLDFPDSCYRRGKKVIAFSQKIIDILMLISLLTVVYAKGWMNWRPWWGGKLCLEVSIRQVACWKSEVGFAEWMSKLRLRFSGHAVSLQTKPCLSLWESVQGVTGCITLIIYGCRCY